MKRFASNGARLVAAAVAASLTLVSCGSGVEALNPTPAEPPRGETPQAAVASTTPNERAHDAQVTELLPEAQRRVVRKRWGDAVSLAVAPLTSARVEGMSGSGQQFAWSTMKLLLTSQALIDAGGPEQLDSHTRGLIRAALSTSSNEAALEINDRLKRRHGGMPGTAAELTKLLVLSGDKTTQVTPGQTEDTNYGKTLWSPADQALFMRQVVRECVLDSQSASFLLGEMGHVVPEQSWGLGKVGAPAFKGGWGPDDEGQYLVRQVGVMEARDGSAFVAAISVVPVDGTFAQGTELITEVSRWLSTVVGSAPSITKCEPHGRK